MNRSTGSFASTNEPSQTSTTAQSLAVTEQAYSTDPVPTSNTEQQHRNDHPHPCIVIHWAPSGGLTAALSHATDSDQYWRECLDCGHEFQLDSTPHDDRCWECAERFDVETEAGR